MLVLVLGGAGYVGCVLVRELLSRGHAVRVCDRLFLGDEGLAELRDRVDVELGDVCSVSAAQLRGLDAVINLAGISSDPIAEFRPELTFRMNVSGAVHLARRCKEAGVRRYLFASSCSVYDRNACDDESDVLFDESSPVAPVSAYARSKLEAETQLLELAGRDFSPTILRKGTVYGFSPRMRYDLVINTLLKDALSSGRMALRAGGEMWRPVVEIRDAARAYAACLEADETLVRGQVLNVVFKNFRVSEMALRIREALRQFDIGADIRPDYAQNRMRSYRVSGDKIPKLLGFTPIVSIEESVRNTVNELRQRGLSDFENARYYNIRWFDRLAETRALESAPEFDGHGTETAGPGAAAGGCP